MDLNQINYAESEYDNEKFKTNFKTLKIYNNSNWAKIFIYKFMTFKYVHIPIGEVSL